MKPNDYIEFHYEGVTICMNSVKQVAIMNVPIGGTYMYSLAMIDRGQEPEMLLEDGMSRTWTAGPSKVLGHGAFNFYGEALKQARAVCGWAWEAHPLQEEVEPDLHALYDDEEDPHVNHPSLTASERNPSLTKRRR